MTAFGLGVLRLRPSEFWAATPMELALAADALFGACPSPPDAATLKRLRALYPD